MKGRFLASIYAIPVALMSVYGRPFFGDVWAAANIAIYLVLPFIIAKYLAKKGRRK
jgi:hypothetical protein